MGFPAQTPKPCESMQDFKWKHCDHWSSISYCCGWGWRARRGPNPLLPAQLGGIKNCSCPEADLFSACTDVLIPLHTPTPQQDTHSKTPSPWTLSWPHNQNKALRWHLLSQEHSPTLWIGISGISSTLQYIFLSCSWCSCFPFGPEMVSSQCHLSFETERNQFSQWPKSVKPSTALPLGWAMFLTKEPRSKGTSKDTECEILNHTSQFA